MFSAEEVLAARFRMVAAIPHTVAPNILSTISYADLDPNPGCARYVTLLQDSRHRSQRSWERACSRHSGVDSSPPVSRPDPLWPASTLSDRNCA